MQAHQAMWADQERDGSDDESYAGSRGGGDGGDMNPLMKFCGIGCCGCVLLLSVVLPLASMRSVEPGHIGLVSTFAYVKEEPMTPGTHIVNPFAVVTPFSTRTTLLDFNQQVPTSQGLMVNLEVAMLYHLDAPKIRNLYLKVGSNYEQTLLRPELESAVRDVTSSRPAEALYNSSRDALQAQLLSNMTTLLAPRGFVVESVLLNDVRLPLSLKKTIEEKAEADQMSKRMVYVLQKESQEAKRKAIEAGGIAKFQETVQRGISPELLQWKGIEATEKFSSPTNTNPKIVIMGNSGKSLPVIFNAEAAETAANGGRRLQGTESKEIIT